MSNSKDSIPCIHKFGGTSVGGAEELKAVANIIRNQTGPTVVVVSAMAGVSDLLNKLLTNSDEGSWTTSLSKLVEDLRNRHQNALIKLIEGGPERIAVADKIDHILDEVSVLKFPESETGLPELSDQLMAVGEDLMVEMTVTALKSQGVLSIGLDARDIICTDSDFGSAVPDIEAIGHLVPDGVIPFLDLGTVPVIQGFIGSDTEGRTTTLGRGGSDLTAVLIGAALGVPKVVLWTDVDGIYSADPNFIATAEVIPEVGFGEAVELSYFGAKVIHSAAVKHAMAQGVLLRIKNTFKPNLKGSLIHFKATETFAAVVRKKDVAMIEVEAFPTALAYGFLARVFEVLGRYQVPVDLVATSHRYTAFTIDRSQDLSELQCELSTFSEVRVVTDISTVTVVGRGLLRESGLNATVFSVVDKTPVYLISQASDVSISFVVDDAESPKLVSRLHSSLIERRMVQKSSS